MAFADPGENITHFDVHEGMKVADFGAGNGAYTLEMARRVGDTGKVYAIDVQKDLLSRLAAEARAKKIFTLEILAGDLDRPHGSGLADGAVDLVLVSNILFQSEDKEVLARETFRVLRRGGTAVVIDWSNSFGGLGPRSQDVVSRDAADMLFRRVGFSSVGSFSAGTHHWGLIFKK